VIKGARDCGGLDGLEGSCLIGKVFLLCRSISQQFPGVLGTFRNILPWLALRAICFYTRVLRAGVVPIVVLFRSAAIGAGCPQSSWGSMNASHLKNRHRFGRFLLVHSSSKKSYAKLVSFRKRRKGWWNG
jgi:hypothetical protein